MKLLRCQAIKLQILILVAVIRFIFKCIYSSVVPQGHWLLVHSSVGERSKWTCEAPTSTRHVVVVCCVAPEKLELLPEGKDIVDIGVVKVEQGVVGRYIII